MKEKLDELEGLGGGMGRSENGEVERLRSRVKDHAERMRKLEDSSRNDQVADLDVPALQELLYQSNPTLEPIAKWPHAPSMRYTPKTVPPVQTDYVGKETTYKGYLDHDQSSGR